MRLAYDQLTTCKYSSRASQPRSGHPTNHNVADDVVSPSRSTYVGIDVSHRSHHTNFPVPVTTTISDESIIRIQDRKLLFHVGVSMLWDKGR